MDEARAAWVALALVPGIGPTRLDALLAAFETPLGGLSAKGLIRLTLDGAKVAAESRIDMQRRVRDVLQAPDSSLLVITDDAKG